MLSYVNGFVGSSPWCDICLFNVGVIGFSKLFFFQSFSLRYLPASSIQALNICVFQNRKQVLKTQQEAERDGVKIPLTMEEYCIKSKPKPPEDDMNDFLCDDYADELDSEESDDEDDLVADSQDSGNEES